MLTMSTLRKPSADFHHGDLHASLIQAGLRYTDKHGLSTLGLRHLAQETGVSPTAVYRHFDDLENLKAEISKASREYLASMMLDAIESASQGMSETACINRLWASGMAYIEFGIRKPNLFEIAFVKFHTKKLSVENPNPWEVLNRCLDDLFAIGILSASKRKAAPMIAWSSVHGYAGLASQGFTGTKEETKKGAEVVLEGALIALGIE